jgi:HMG-box domain
METWNHHRQPTQQAPTNNQRPLSWMLPSSEEASPNGRRSTCNVLEAAAAADGGVAAAAETRMNEDPLAALHDIDLCDLVVPWSDSSGSMHTTQGPGLQAPSATVPPFWTAISKHDDASSAGVATTTTPSSKTPPTPLESNKPKRPLTAYNIFFKFQRQQILSVMPVRATGKPRKSHGKMGFADMARVIAGKWKTIRPQEKVIFVEMAATDKKRYKQEMVEWKQNKSSSNLIIKSSNKSSADSHAPHCGVDIRNDIMEDEPVADGETTNLFTMSAPPTPPQDPHHHHLALLQSLGAVTPKEEFSSQPRIVPFLQMNHNHKTPVLASEPLSLLEVFNQSLFSRGASNHLGLYDAPGPTTTSSTSRLISWTHHHGAALSNDNYNYAAQQQHYDGEYDDNGDLGGFASLAAKLGSDGCDLLLELLHNNNNNN